MDVDTGLLKNHASLRKTLAPYVDIYERPRDAADFPEVHKEIIDIPMSERQEKLYKYLMRKLPGKLRRAVSNNLG